MKDWERKVFRMFVLSGIMLVFLSMTAWAGLEISKANFPDEEFRKIVSAFDKDKNGFLDPDECAAVTEIDCEKNKQLRNVTGIEHFAELKGLSCWECPLEKLDVSANKKLEYIDICETGLAMINVSANPQIHQLWAYGNKITTLDLSNCQYLSKAVKNGVYDTNRNNGTACSYADEDTNSFLVVDKTVTIKLSERTVSPLSEGETAERNASKGNNADRVIGGVAAPSEGATFPLGSTVPIDIRPTGAVSLGGIHISGTCIVTQGSKTVLSEEISESGTVGSVKYEFKPDRVGTYMLTVQLKYTISGYEVDTSRYTRTFTVADVNSTAVQDNSSGSDHKGQKEIGSQTDSSQVSEQEPITIAKAPASVKTKVKKNKVTVSWKKIKKNKAGKKLLNKIKSIQIQYSTDLKFRQNVKTKTVGKKKTKVTLKLQKKTTYYIRVRYKGSNGFSKWSKVKKVKTKK